MRYYKCLTQNHYSYNDYQLLPIRKQDIMLIKDWRNAQIDVLRQKEPLTEQGQREYFEKIIWPSLAEERPLQVLFSFLKKDTCIGYGGIVHINWEDKRGEVSFLLNPERVGDQRVYREDFLVYLRLLKEVAYGDLGFHRLTGETFDIRPFHVAILEEAGFCLEGRMKRHVYLNGAYLDSLIHGHLKEYDEARCPVKPQVAADLNVLVTSVSRKIPLLKAVRAAMTKAGYSGRLIGADSNQQCLARYFVDDFWSMPPLEKLKDQKLLGELNLRKVKCIIPSRDGELLFWSERKQWLRKHGIEVMVSDPKSIGNCLDKLLFYTAGKGMELPVITTSDKIDDINADTLVVKDRFGAGARNIRLNLSREKALQYAALLKTPIFQPYLQGKEYSVDAYITRSGQIKGVICRTRDIVIDGESQVTSTIFDQFLENKCVEYMKKLNLYGHIIIQLLHAADGIHIIECNPRFGGASTLSVTAGLDSFYWFLLETVDEEIEKYPFSKATIPLKQVRYPCDLLIEQT